MPQNDCSLWKRVLSLLDGKHEGSAVFNLSCETMHTSHSFHLLGSDESLLHKHYVLRSSKKIMFAQDPYERLFSGYIDAFLSPCSFTNEEIKIVNLPRTSETKCRAGVSFTEFLHYVTTQKVVPVDPHFERQYSACLPCHADFDYIGKMETFQQDAEYILKDVAHIHPSEVYRASDDFDQKSDLNTIYDVAERTFRECYFKTECVSQYNVLLRLWIVFQVSRVFLSCACLRICLGQKILLLTT